MDAAVDHAEAGTTKSKQGFANNVTVSIATVCAQAMIVVWAGCCFCSRLEAIRAYHQQSQPKRNVSKTTPHDTFRHWNIVALFFFLGVGKKRNCTSSPLLSFVSLESSPSSSLLAELSEALCNRAGISPLSAHSSEFQTETTKSERTRETPTRTRLGSGSGGASLQPSRVNERKRKKKSNGKSGPVERAREALQTMIHSSKSAVSGVHRKLRPQRTVLRKKKSNNNCVQRRKVFSSAFFVDGTGLGDFLDITSSRVVKKLLRVFFSPHR